MNYYDFCECKYVKKNLPNLGILTGRDIDITMTEKTYIKKGNKWIIDNITTDTIKVDNYIYTIDAIPFFRNLGGYEHIEKRAVCPYGYIPVKLISINPDRTEKVIREFKFN